MKMSNKTFNCYKVVKVDALQAKLKVMSSFCCRQGVYNTLQKPSYDFGIMQSKKGRQCLAGQQEEEAGLGRYTFV